ncbi:YesN/AraC family two-component response regulator [Bacillus mesophilus]|uniref:AraC family transcriptional regulator n=1 Tax=Bacillus mesophilus TaxID=1808955 RepID=A0A6M0Q7N0_9BACI|nr:helix-turn-helix domain-containing protein [Bacillus mesophilus]MBM7661680.1 YesN/AraC family two-component response regulator [Bacillus mesophilus]NEY72342.1 AraC family transcriptional regulator [Bacillus mesophilus]
MNVLLVDDEPIELDQLELLIHDHFPKWQIEKKRNGSEALTFIKQMKKEGITYHLAFIDIMLSGKNGLDIAAEMKELMPSMDFIVVSAFQEFEYAKQSMYLKALDYLVKPIIESEFKNVLNGYVNKYPEHGIDSEVIQQAIKIVQERYQEPIKLSDISRELHINANYFSRLFSEEVGIPFSDYLLQHRIEMAKQLLLKKKNWSIQRVAEECGFNSQHYFSTSFKKITQFSPLRYRNSAS